MILFHVVENIPGDTNSVAFFKFCYVDINDSSDVEAIFEYYKEKMYYLKIIFQIAILY